MTAEDIILKHCTTKTNDYGTSFGSINETQCKNAMIEFAKHHVEQALKEAVNNMKDSYVTDQDVEDILNCYPPEKIK